MRKHELWIIEPEDREILEKLNELELPADIAEMNGDGDVIGYFIYDEKKLDMLGIPENIYEIYVPASLVKYFMRW